MDRDHGACFLTGRGMCQSLLGANNNLFVSATSTDTIETTYLFYRVYRTTDISLNINS
jgi:hypothetical protein